MDSQPTYILWLPSWYPNSHEPYNGDFVQRHARAASLYTSIVVCHICQFGETITVAETRIDKRENGNLIEFIVYPKFLPIGISIIDKLRYNTLYYSTAKKQVKKIITNYGKPALVHVHVPLKAGLVAQWIKRTFGIDYLVSEHSSHYYPYRTGDFYKKSLRHRMQVKSVFSNARQVTNVSENIARILRREFSLPPITIVRNAVDCSLFYPSSSKPPGFQFIHVSGMNEQKNIKGLLKTFGKYVRQDPDCRLNLVGPASKDVIELIATFQLANKIQLTGEVGYDEVARQMRSSHALVMFSRHENFPCVIIEALCCGLPVIATDVGGTNEAVNASNGILLQSENEQQLLEAFAQIKSTYQSYDRAAIAAKASMLYSYETIGEQFHAVYQL